MPSFCRALVHTVAVQHRQDTPIAAIVSMARHQAVLGMAVVMTCPPSTAQAITTMGSCGCANQTMQF